MASTSPVLLILGAGANVGAHVARSFAAKGYKVALASRSAKPDPSNPDQFNVASDLSDPSSVVDTFSKVKSSLGHPSVVVYNAAGATFNKADDPLSLPLSDFNRDFAINTTSAFVALQQAALSFSQLPASASRTFIYTGNLLNETTMAPLLSLGVGKTATAHIIQSASAAYKDKGFKFYYADERKTDGSAAFRDIDGEAAGVHYFELSEGKEQGPWQQTFVKGHGYRDFSK